MQLVIKIKKLLKRPPAENPASKLRDADYLSAICHEIGTPLAAIIGLSHIISSKEYSAEKKVECAKMLHDSSNMLNGFMKDLLNSFKMEAGMIEIENIEFSPARVVLEAMNMVATRATEKCLELNVHIEDGPPLAQYMGDPMRIRQILVNLLSNAVKFTETGKVSILVSTTTDLNGNDKLCFTVADTGIGISKKGLKKIFSKYTQANSSITRKYGGTGLGLSISRDLAHLMDGDITVKSLPGVGSQFMMTLPLQKTAACIAA